MDLNSYNHIRSGGAGFTELSRGLIAVWGKEAVQFLDGMITNDMKTLVDGEQMLAAFPNAQGRLLAVVRVLRQGDRYLIETEAATREKVFQNLFRFTFAGDFFVEDLSEQYCYFELFGSWNELNKSVSEIWKFTGGRSQGIFVQADRAEEFAVESRSNGIVEISPETFEVLRVESGIPLFGVDMDEATIVPELGLEGLISYTKGCYIGQEIIARIHFRGHVAKQLTGLILSDNAEFDNETELDLLSDDNKNAGKITSAAYSPHLNKTIALGYVRYSYLPDGTQLKIGDRKIVVTDLPFVS